MRNCLASVWSMTRHPEVRPSTRDQMIGAIAARNSGLITTRQLLDLGLSEGSIADRVASRRLVRVFRGVYLVAVPKLDHATFQLASLFARSVAAALVDDSAAEVHGLLPTRRGIARVGVPGLSRRRTQMTDLPLTDGGRGIVYLRGATFPVGEIADREGRRATTVGRTLLDLARFDDDRFDRAWREASYLNVLDPPAIEATLAIGRRDGAARLRSKYRAEYFVDTGKHGVDSPAELDFVKLLAAAGAPAPLVNHWVRTATKHRRLDLFWQLASLVVEVDGWGGHKTRESFEDDRVRDVELLAMGLTTMRFTYRRATDDPVWCCEQVLAQLARRLPV